MSRVQWIKLDTDFYKNEKMRVVRSLAKGERLVEHVWVLLLALAGKRNTGGGLLIKEDLPYDAQMLADEFDLPCSLIEQSLSIFMRLGMVLSEEETYIINGWQEHQDLEKMERIREKDKLRKRKARAQKKAEQAQGEPEEQESPILPPTVPEYDTDTFYHRLPSGGLHQTVIRKL